MGLLDRRSEDGVTLKLNSWEWLALVVTVQGEMDDDNHI